MSAERARMESQDVQQGVDVQQDEEQQGGQAVDIAKGRLLSVEEQLAGDLRIIARRTREAFEEADTSYEMFASRCSMSVSTLVRILQGAYTVQKGPLLKTIVKLRAGGVFLPEFK